MEIRIKWFDGERPQFNVQLASGPGKEEFLSIKACRIVDGSKGPFVSWPATKGTSDKYWQHVWASEAFAAAVLEKAQEAMPKPASKRGSAQQKGGFSDLDDLIPF